MRALAGGYYVILRSILRAFPHSCLCRKQCRLCGIFFLTHRRNQAREDVACPFGCREAHQKQQSNERSAAYYRDHPEKKRAQNQKRYRVASKPPSSGEPEITESNGEKEKASVQPIVQGEGLPQTSECPSELESALPEASNPALMECLQVVIQSIEKRSISLEAIWEALLHFWRQHSIGKIPLVDQILSWMIRNPP